MFPHISIVINDSYKALNCFLLVGTAMSFIVCTVSGKGIIPCLVILKPIYSKLSLANFDYSALILKPATLSSFETIFTLFGWSSKLPLLLIIKLSIYALTYSKPLNIFSWKIPGLLYNILGSYWWSIVSR